MTRNLLQWVATPAVLAAMVSTASAQKTTDEHVQELIRLAAQRAGAPSQSATTGAQTRDSAAPATLSLSLDDAIRLALDRNLDIAVQRLNPQTFDYSIGALRAVYKPTLTSRLANNSVLNPPTNTLQGVPAGQNGITQTTATFNGGFLQNLRWGGGNVNVSVNNSRNTTNSTTSTLNPFFSTLYSAQYTQPLMRGFRIDNTRQQLMVTGLNQDISEIQLQALIINTVSNVRNAYWDYVFAVQSVDVAKRSVALAEQLVKDNQTRVEVGTMAPIDIVQAQSQAATQRQNLATAEGTRRTAELTLKRLIVGGTDDPNWSLSLDPVDRPDFVPAPIDVAAAVRRGLENRTDLQQAKKNIQVNDVSYKYLHDLTLPQVDFVGTYGMVGRGGTGITRSGNGLGGSTILGTTPGGYLDALSTMFGHDYPTWTAQVNIAYPLGTS